MNSISDILAELQSMGSESTKRTLLRHGACEPLFGVKVGDMKTIVKRIKKDHPLSLALYNTGNSDAMYLAGLIADEKKISKDELRQWAAQAHWSMLSECTVAWVAAESPHGWALALEWIESDQENIAATGWSTLSSWLGICPDTALEIPALEKLLDRVAATILEKPNRVRYTMNGFIMSAGISVAALTKKALQVGAQLGDLSINVGETACKVPYSVDYIQKAIDKGHLGHKKKMARC